MIASTDYYALKLIFSDVAKSCTVIGFDNTESVSKFNIPIMTVAVDRAWIADKIVEYVTTGNCGDNCFATYKIVGEEYVKF